MLNPFVPELPVPAQGIYVPSTSCDIISFNRQGQLTRAGRSHTRIFWVYM